ncbi:hypothetical protein BHM03_00008623 [Ensete ventricosum]|nr:hypothetical protein BHM03_00008623 [Ensete ventricosum]
MFGMTGPRFAISTYTARYRRYIPIRKVTGSWTARYLAVQSKIDCWRSILVVGDRFRPSAVDFGRRRSIEREIDRRRSIEREIDRRRSIEEEKGKKKRKRRKKKKRGRKNTTPAGRPWPRPLFLPRGEKDRGDRAVRVLVSYRTDMYHPYRAVWVGMANPA